MQSGFFQIGFPVGAVRLPITALFRVFILCAVLLIAHPEPEQVASPTPSAYIPQEYHFVWGDEFDGVGLNAAKWTYRYVNRPRDAGFLAEEAIAQPGDGNLHLITSYQDNKFLNGMIQSSASFQCGYFEARIRFQSLQGHHGAFWLQSPLYGKFLDNPGRSGAEIDIAEFFGSGRLQEDTKLNVYWNGYGSEQQTRTQDIYYRQQHGVELSNDFHLFALLWTPEGYTFYIDGGETWRLDEGISDTPEYIVLSLLTSSWENQYLDGRQLPNEMLVDYVRVYRPN